MRFLFAVVALLVPVAALAEVPVLEISAGSDRLALTAGQIDSANLLGVALPQEIAVVLKADQTAPLAELTARHVGEELVIKVCGEEVMRPVLRDPITGGRFSISLADQDAAQRFTALLQAPDCLR